MHWALFLLLSYSQMLHEHDAYHLAWRNTQPSDQIPSLMAEQSRQKGTIINATKSETLKL
jgi:hypothetical protein